MSEPVLQRPAMPDVDIDIDVSPSLHPQNVLSIAGYDATTSGYVSKALEAFETAYAGLSAIHKARKAAEQDPTLTEAGRLLKVADFASKHQNTILPKFDAAHAMLTKAIDSNEGMLNTPLKQSAERPVIASEIRNHVKGLSVDERNKFFNERQAAGDVESLQAVLGAPSFLSGISDNERTVRTRHYHLIKSPDIAKRLAVMHAARDRIETSGPLVLKELEKGIGADMRKVTKLRNATTEAEKAFVMSDGAGSAVVR